MLIKRIQNSRLLQLLTAVILLATVALLVFIINIIPVYNPIRVDINHTGLITPSGRNMALYNDEVYYFTQGSEGRGIYVSSVNDDTSTLLIAVDRIDGLAVNQSSVFYVTVGENGFGEIVHVNKNSGEEVARTISIRYIKGIAADETYVYFQACVTEQNSCNSVSGLEVAKFVEVIVEEEVVAVDDFRIFKNDMVNNDDPANFFMMNFQIVTIDPTNNRQVAYY